MTRARPIPSVEDFVAAQCPGVSRDIVRAVVAAFERPQRVERPQPRVICGASVTSITIDEVAS